MSTTDDLSNAHLHHIEAALEKINARIARLSMLLDIPLNDEQAWNKVMEGHMPILPRWDILEKDKQRQRQQIWEELRGLMVLRLHLIKDTLEELGLEPTLRIAQFVQEHMTQEGFQTGSAGFDLLQRLQAEHDRRQHNPG
jgi:hypothetical protein